MGSESQNQLDGETVPLDNDTLADMAAVELLHTLEAPIGRYPAATIHNYDHARKLVKAALLAVFEAANSAAQPQGE